MMLAMTVPPVLGAGALCLCMQSRKASSWTTQITPAVKGERLADVDTPALCLDYVGVKENIKRLEKLVVEGKMKGVTVRPIVKAHKCSMIAKMQCQSKVVKGVCCAKVCEVEAMLYAGITDVYLSNEVIGEKKMKRLVKAMKENNVEKIRAAVDSVEGVEGLAKAGKEGGVSFDVVIEVSCGQKRCGVYDAPNAVTIAQKITENSDVLTLLGIQAYQGAAQHIREKAEMKREIENVVEVARSVTSALSKGGFFAHLKGRPVVTGAGSGTLEFELASGVFTELQPGSYLFNDVDYSKNLAQDGGEEGDTKWKASMFILTTVMSHTTPSTEPHWVIVDAGLKSHSIDSGPPRLYGNPHVTCVNGGDEHFKLIYPPEHPLPPIGSKLLLQPGHVDPTFNMHDHAVVFEGQLTESSESAMKTNPVVKDVWRIDARGPGF